MKLGKAMKKLKFWSRKNRKPKNNFKYSQFYPPPPLSPPPPPYQCRYSWPPPEPSAPPMPPWYVPDETDTNIYQSSGPALGKNRSDENTPEIRTPEKPYHPGSPVLGNECFDENALEIGTSSYQQYLVPEKPDEANTYPILGNECIDKNAPEIGTSSYQLYLVDDPVYDVSVLEPEKREKRDGVFGCAVSIGKHLFEALFGCFSIREKSRRK